MYETKVTFKHAGIKKPQWLKLLTDSHPEDISNSMWQSLVFGALINPPKDLTYKGILIIETEYLGNADTVTDILKEFVEDVKSAYGTDLDAMDWPDLKETYHKAVKAFKDLRE
jgi:hypothetical protein